MTSLMYLVNTLFSLLMFIFMLRMWFQYSHVDFYNPLSQTLVKITNPVLLPLRKFIPTIKNVDLAAVFFVFLLGTVKFPLLAIVSGTWNAELIQHSSTYLLAGILTAVKVFGQMILYVIFIGAILSWFSRGNDQFSYLLFQLGEPVLTPIRRFLPKTGMIDFSPMILAFILFFANNLMYDLLPNLWGFI